ncbi:hypothetical protein H9655_00705 [Cytobacillus sp. Sa5YUA1]|uniref:DUF1878 domain-containing protein n=1 Tax=Cytobacillus stercorigallinarum TaxID=2762240 RepID=A0ABR8QJC7_9BACI|nr:hypothetical protein [Cytobacillus stercorigallinarum]MBD7935534.1 hypothetical protein [Cytobacillus stercorigallinarum]
MNQQIEEELKLLKFQIKLLKMAVPNDDYPYFMYLLDHDITEKQSNLIKDILVILNIRNKTVFSEYKKGQPEIAEGLIEELNKFHINEQQLFSDEKPSYEEFEFYIKQFLPSHVNPIYLLQSLEKQSLFKNIAKYLLDNLTFKE